MPQAYLQVCTYTSHSSSSAHSNLLMTSPDSFKAVAIHGPLHGPGAHEAVCGDTKRFKHLLKHLYKSPSATDANPWRHQCESTSASISSISSIFRIHRLWKYNRRSPTIECIAPPSSPGMQSSFQVQQLLCQTEKTDNVGKLLGGSTKTENRPKCPNWWLPTLTEVAELAPCDASPSPRCFSWMSPATSATSKSEEISTGSIFIACESLWSMIQPGEGRHVHPPVLHLFEPFLLLSKEQVTLVVGQL